VENGSVAYFDQLALLQAWRTTKWAPLLAIAAVDAVAANGATDMFATTVHAPVENRAAWRLLQGFRACRVGRIAEQHPLVGALVSDIHHAPRAVLLAQVAAWRARLEAAGGTSGRRPGSDARDVCEGCPRNAGARTKAAPMA